MLKPSFTVSPARQQLLAARAHDMRVFAPEPEHRLWQELRGQRLGVVFSRQVVLGRHVADFAAPSIRLVVEVDGPIHARHRSYDARRDRDLGRLGYHVLRIPAALVMKEFAAAMAMVRRTLNERRR